MNIQKTTIYLLQSYKSKEGGREGEGEREKDDIDQQDSPTSQRPANFPPYTHPIYLYTSCPITLQYTWSIPTSITPHTRRLAAPITHQSTHLIFLLWNDPALLQEVLLDTAAGDVPVGIIMELGVFSKATKEGTQKSLKREGFVGRECVSLYRAWMFSLCGRHQKKRIWACAPGIVIANCFRVSKWL